MPGHHYTPVKYALRQRVESFGNLLFQLDEARLTHIYGIVFLFCEHENIGYSVLRNLHTSALLFKAFSKEWLFDREA
jgi:hypothetical protein